MFRVSLAHLVRFTNAYSIGLFVYFGIALVSALTEWGGFIAALRFAAPLPAATAGFILATLLNFVLSRRFAFRSKRTLSAEFVLVVAMSAVAFTGNILLFYVLYAVAEVNMIMAKILGTCFGFVFNYAFRQFFIFSHVSRFLPVSQIVKGRKCNTEADNYPPFDTVVIRDEQLSD
jgi:putative flippase GtrA